MTQLTMTGSDWQTEILRRFVRVEDVPVPARYVVSAGDKHAGARGCAIAIISLQGAGGYTVVLRLDDGRLLALDPMRLLPEHVR